MFIYLAGNRSPLNETDLYNGLHSRRAEDSLLVGTEAKLKN